MAAMECSKGIELLNSNIMNLIFRGFFKVKKALTIDEAIITAVNDNGDDIRDYIFKKQGDNTFVYEEALMKICQENFRYYSDPQNYTKILNPTIEYILNLQQLITLLLREFRIKMPKLWLMNML
ncbi:hypothetical protein REISMN_04875 [Rickettsia tamurae subsp. buchneri]|uniref:Uncharacterized protein n=3 Tax=Rickettsia TaxID=780 RepID=A0A8E0WLR9_9RICK|nr:hypothetical protein REISMN_04875 [Rickettsia tamurae subsp. buchneri]